MDEGDGLESDNMLHGVFFLEDVVKLGRRAYCESADGEVHEYDHGCFWVRHQGADAERRLVERLADLPFGPWRHSPTCDCPRCRPHASG